MQVPVLVGLSGGVDSFVTALMLQRQGYRVVGAHLRLWGNGDISGLEGLCKDLGIEWLHYDGRAEFRRLVVEPFVSEYVEGRTPNPCAWCNNSIKWNLLMRLADEAGIYHFATGHYVRIGEYEGRPYLYKGIDPNKDQSYFLWGLGRDVLARAMTPLGDYTKREVKEFAAENGYEAVADRKESMGICFLEGTDYRDFVAREAERNDLMASGDIRDRAGNVIGRHTGLLNYTVGQKRDMPVVNGQSYYVAEIDAVHCRIVADLKHCLNASRIIIGGTSFIAEDEWRSPDIEVKVRGLGLNPPGYVKIEQLADGNFLLNLSEPAWAVAPGQPVALYRGERLIGGGIAVTAMN